MSNSIPPSVADCCKTLFLSFLTCNTYSRTFQAYPGIFSRSLPSHLELVKVIPGQGNKPELKKGDIDPSDV